MPGRTKKLTATLMNKRPDYSANAIHYTYHLSRPVKYKKLAGRRTLNQTTQHILVIVAQQYVVNKKGKLIPSGAHEFVAYASNLHGTIESYIPLMQGPGQDPMDSLDRYLSNI